MVEMLGPSSIETAFARIRGHIRRTPSFDADGAIFGLPDPVSLKLELLQHAGSFKPRGAFNNLLGRAVPEAGVTAASGGNHGAAVAYVAACLGLKARIFVPRSSNQIKIERIKSYGAEVVVEGERYDDAAVLSQAYAAEVGAFPIHPFDNPDTITGQGTVGLEWDQDEPDLDTVLVATGGGGLVAGIGLWFQNRVRVVAVEPEGSRALHAARQSGGPIDVAVDSIAADALGARRAGELAYSIAMEYVADIVLVPDAAIKDAQRRFWRGLGIATEPGAATAAAALTTGAYKPKPGERVGVLVCGSNVDLATLAVTVS